MGSLGLPTLGVRRRAQHSELRTDENDQQRVSMRIVCAAALASLALSLLVPASAAERRFEVGTLTCRLAPKIGLTVGSRQRIDCQFGTNRHGHTERYLGTVARFGLDLGMTAGGVMRWKVLMNTRAPGHGALAGHYVGASGAASLGVGVGQRSLSPDPAEQRCFSRFPLFAASASISRSG
jgi:Protein of unknown function (DUF992)